jgi:hypothetical protein
MIHLWSCDRRRLVDYLTNRTPLSAADVRTADALDGILLHGDEILLIWSKSPAEVFALPRAVVVAEGALRDFLAWVSTYFRQIRPFTAHCHVLTPAMVRLCDQAVSAPPVDLRSANVGLIVAEGVAYSVGRADWSRLPFGAFARTLSYAFAEGVNRYGDRDTEKEGVFDHIRSGWQAARELAHQASLDLSPASIRDVWAVVLAACGGDTAMQARRGAQPALVEALQAVRGSGRVPVEAWKKLAGRLTKGEAVLETLEGPREARVKAVESALRELAHGPEDSRRERAFIAGYMASRIQPGSLEHFPVLFPVTAELREGLLWYGACSGLTPESSVNAYGNGLGWLMKRELGRPSHWLDRPNCDIALSEMSILLTNREGTKPNIPTLASGALTVALFPQVSTSVKWSEYGEDHFVDKGAPTTQSRTLFDEDARLREDVLEIVRRIDDSARALDAIRRLAETTLGEKPSKSRNRKR